MTQLDSKQTPQKPPLPHLASATQFLETICQEPWLAAIFQQTLPVLGQQLRCDRVFLYVRSPYQQVGRVPFCWQRHEAIPQVYDPDWKAEPRNLPDQDPMFAAALEAKPSLFIEDVETASPNVVNRAFEAKTFGHRALIHAHLCVERKLWGILQACIFDQPRRWNYDDHQLMERAVGWFSPLAMEYVHCHLSAEHTTVAP
jgi:GAF domain-containing protein